MIPFKIFLTEMSFKKHWVENKIRDISPNILLHFMKLIYIKRKNDYKHWIKEINTNIIDIDDKFIKLKGKEKKLKNKTYFKLLYSEPIEPINLKRHKIKLKKLYPNNNIKIINDDIVIENLITTYKDISDSLSKDNYLIKSDEFKLKFIELTKL